MSNKIYVKVIAVSVLTALLTTTFITYFNTGKIVNTTTKTETNLNTGTKTNNVDSNNNVNSDLEITIIGDKRCTDCHTTEIVSQLRQTPFLKGAKFEVKDFSDKGVKELMNEKDMKLLPIVLLNKGKVDESMDKFLTKIDDKSYSLELGAKFDPFQKRSEKGFLVMDKADLQNVKDNSYIKGNKDAKITWLEYSDLECPFCAKLHNSGTEGELIKKYGDKLNIIYNHFPLGFHKDAQKAAEALECIGEQKGGDIFYKAISKSYTTYGNNDFDLEGFYKLAEKDLDINKDTLLKCIDSGKYKEKVIKGMQVGATKFKVTGTPGNVLINNETGEYTVISGAYPTTEFVKIIDKLLK